MKTKTKMKRTMIAALLLVGLSVQLASTDPVQARRYCPQGGYCPPGTCVKFNPWARHQHACNVASCSAANCSR
jgi:hypothetical protein